MVSSEFVSSSCGCVVNDRILHVEGVPGAANASEYSDRTRTDMPESLATHHKGLSTLMGTTTLTQGERCSSRRKR
ncbi:MAG TPA: hypothetical protein VGJ42_02630 [Nitrososphaera sp.]